MRKITADFVFPVSPEPVANGVVVVDDAGKILAVERRHGHDPASLEVHRGALIPVFDTTNDTVIDEPATTDTPGAAFASSPFNDFTTDTPADAGAYAYAGSSSDGAGNG